MIFQNHILHIMADQISLNEICKMVCVTLIILWCIISFTTLVICVTRIELCSILYMTLCPIFIHTNMFAKNDKDKELHEISKILMKNKDDIAIDENMDISHDVVK